MSDAVKQGHAESFDWWNGTAEQLVALGLATLDEFPGQPGRPLTSVSYRPVQGKQTARSWHRAPGMRSIYRRGIGFHFRRVVSIEEQCRRREAAADARKAEERQLDLERRAGMTLPFDLAAEIASGVRVDRAKRRETITATRAQLIASGHCAERFFPDGNKRVRYGVGVFDDSWRIRKVKGGLFELTEWLDSSELDRRAWLRKVASEQLTRPAPPERSRGQSHLRLAWSAPLGEASH